MAMVKSSLEDTEISPLINYNK